MECDSGRFTHGCLFERKRIVEENEIPFFYCDIFREAAVSAGTVIIIVAALCVITCLTCCTLSARYQREYGCAFSDKLLVVSVDNLAGELMSRDSREMICAFLEYSRDIASADSAGANLHEDFAFFPDRIRNFLISEVSDCM